MKQITPFKWLVIVMIDTTVKIDNEPDISLIIERGSMLKSIKMARVNDEEIKVVAIIAKNSKFRLRSGENFDGVEVYFLEKKGAEFVDFDKNYLDGVNHSYGKGSFQFFLERIAGSYDADNRIIVTLGHGSVLGVNFRAVLPARELKNSQFMNELIEEAKEDPKLTGAELELVQNYKPIGPAKKFAGDTFYILSNKEISEALLAVFSREDRVPVDIFAMSNCFMQNIFAQHDLHKAVGYFVAPISGISFPGYHIQEILQTLPSATDIPAVANLFVDRQSIMRHRMYAKHADKIESRWFVQSAKLNAMNQDDFKTLFQQFIHEIVTLLKDSVNRRFKKIVKQVIFDCYKYSELSLSTVDLVDLKVFVKGVRFKLLTVNASGIEGRFDDVALLTAIENLVSQVTNQSFKYIVGDKFISNPETFLDFRKGFGALSDLNDLSSIGMGFYLPIAPGNNTVLIFENQLQAPDLVFGSEFLKMLQLLE